MATTHNLSISVPNFPISATGKTVANTDNLSISVPKFPIAVTRLLTQREIYQLVAKKCRVAVSTVILEEALFYDPRTKIARELKRTVNARKPI